MNPYQRKFSRRSTILLGGSALLGLAACKKEPSEAEKNAAATKAQEAQLEAGRKQIAEIQNAAKANLEQEVKHREELIAAERKSLTEYYKGVVAGYEEKNKALTTQLMALASRTPTTPDEQKKINDAVNPPPPPQPNQPPPPTDASKDKDKQANALASLMMAALAIAFPELAPIIALFAGGGAGLSSSESEEFSNHLTTGAPMSSDLSNKVANNSSLKQIDDAAAAARSRGINMVKPQSADTNNPNRPTPPPPTPPPTTGVAPPPATTGTP